MSAIFPAAEARRTIAAALREDLGAAGDRTTRAVLAPGTKARATLVAREPTTLAGLPCAEIVMQEIATLTGGTVAVESHARDGETCPAATILATFDGDAWPLLAGERVLLNLIARLCGIATLTAQAVAEVAGTQARVADTRKTTPGLRALEKYAVAVAGGENHRSTLDQLILVKDNHKALAGGLPAILRALATSSIALSDVEIEVDNLTEFTQLVDAGVGWILLDNMEPADVAQAVALNRGRARLEVSGGLTLGRLRRFAELGVDRLSLGTLTHGARAIDLGLDIASA